MAEADPPPLADLLEPSGDALSGKGEDLDFRLTLAVDARREKALMLRVVVVLEVIVALVVAREIVLLFFLDG